MGVRGKPIGIDLDGENLLKLSIGQYTFLDLQRGEFDMVVTSWTVEGPDNAMAETSRDFHLDLAKTDSVYLLFTLEKIDFWEILGQKYSEMVDNAVDKLVESVFSDTITVPVGKYVSLQFSSERKRQLLSQNKPGIGYTVESVSRQAAVEAASKLEPVEGAQHSPLHK